MISYLLFVNNPEKRDDLESFFYRISCEIYKNIYN